MTVMFRRCIAFVSMLVPALVHAQQPTVRVLTVVTNEALEVMTLTPQTASKFRRKEVSMKIKGSELSRALSLSLLAFAVAFGIATGAARAAGGVLFSPSDLLRNDLEQQMLTKAELERVRQFRSIGSAWVVKLDPTALQESLITFTLPEVGVQRLRKTGDESTQNGDVIWIGEKVGGGDDEGLRSDLLLSDGKIVGGLMLGRKSYSIEPLGNKYHLIIWRDPKKILRHSASDRPTDNRPSAVPQDIQVSTRDATAAAASVAGKPQIDILFVFTPAAVSIVRSIDQKIISEVSRINAAMTSSGVNASFSSVGKLFVNQELTQSQALNVLTDNSTVINERNRLYADVVVVANIVPGVEYGRAREGVIASWAVAVVTPLAFDSQNYTVAHEIGHVLGADHDADTLVSKNEQPLHLPDGRGYVMRSCLQYSGCHYDIMSYGPPNGGCSLQPVYSNQSINYHGSAFGVDGVSNNVRIMNTRVSEISRFRDRITTRILNVINSIIIFN